MSCSAMGLRCNACLVALHGLKGVRVSSVGFGLCSMPWHSGYL